VVTAKKQTPTWCSSPALANRSYSTRTLLRAGRYSKQNWPDTDGVDRHHRGASSSPAQPPGPQATHPACRRHKQRLPTATAWAAAVKIRNPTHSHHTRSKAAAAMLRGSGQKACATYSTSERASSVKMKQLTPGAGSLCRGGGGAGAGQDRKNVTIGLRIALRKASDTPGSTRWIRVVC
jgi:hypothetical protein